VEDIGRSVAPLTGNSIAYLADNETPPLLDSIRPWTLVQTVFGSEDFTPGS